MSLVEARRLRWTAGGREILAGVDLELDRGECVGLIGPNGAGKTTLLRLLCGLLAPNAGEVHLDGRPLAGWPARERAKRIAYVPQLSPVEVPLTVRRLLLSARYPYLGRTQLAPAQRDFEAVARAAAEVGIEPLLERPLSTLSGGERQIAFLAAALAQESPIVLLDEPTTHLDAGNQRRVAERLLALAQRGSRTLLVATHDLGFAARLCRRLVALRDGEVVAEGTPREVLTSQRLAELFEAPFRILDGAGEPLPVLDFDTGESASRTAR